jgi:uncharacterized protein YndB with AHSA1/START domain
MVRKILLGVAAAVVLFVIVVTTRPSAFHVERSVTIDAPPEAAFARVNDFRAWGAWSPYEKLDPQLKRTFEGAPSGAGAVYSWVGNDKVGEGRMTIEESDKPSRVALKLELLRPCNTTNAVTFTFAPSPEGTKVTWAMDGQCNFFAKAASLFLDLDKLVGADFERGLAALKAESESGSKAAETTAAK